MGWRLGSTRGFAFTWQQQKACPLALKFGIETYKAFLAGSFSEHTGLLKEFLADLLWFSSRRAFHLASKATLRTLFSPILRPKPKSTDSIYFWATGSGEQDTLRATTPCPQADTLTLWSSSEASAQEEVLPWQASWGPGTECPRACVQD